MIDRPNENAALTKLTQPNCAEEKSSIMKFIMWAHSEGIHNVDPEGASARFRGIEGSDLFVVMYKHWIERELGHPIATLDMMS